VPPRLGTKGSAAVKSAKPARSAGVTAPDRSWYSKKQLTMLYRTDRRTFDKLVERVQDIKRLVADEEAAEALAERRALLEPAVEAGLLNQAEADRKLAAWAKSNGIAMPAS
jgi:phage portal protein BeeE